MPETAKIEATTGKKIGKILQEAESRILTEARARLLELRAEREGVPAESVEKEEVIEAGDEYYRHPRTGEEGRLERERREMDEGLWPEEKWRIAGEGTLKEGKLREPAPYQIFESARDKYIKEYQNYIRSKQERLNFIRKSLQIFGIGQREGELPEELQSAREKYEEAKFTYAKAMFEDEKRALEKEELPMGYSGTVQEYRENELEKYRLKIFEELIVNEKRLLQHSQIESFPPKDKTRVGKLLEWYMKRDWKVRVAASTALMSGIVFVSGGFAAAPALSFAYARALKGFSAVGLGQGAGKGIELTWGRKIEERKKEAIQKLKDNFTLEKTKEADQFYQEILKDYDKAQRRKIGAKAVVMAATGAGASIGLNMFADAWSGGATKTDVRVRPTYPPESPKSGEPPPELEKVIPGESYIETAREHFEDLATVRKGEGVWHAVYRQLEDQLKTNPDSFADRYGWEHFNPDDLENQNFLKKILNRQTNELLVGNKIIGDTELRIVKPGVRVILTHDNQIEIEGEGQLTYEWSKPEAEADLEGEPEISENLSIPPKSQMGSEALESSQPPEDLPEGTEVQSTETKISGEIPTERVDLGESVLQYDQTPKRPSEFALSPEKQEYLDSLVQRSILSNKQIYDLAKQVKEGRISVKDIISYNITRVADVGEIRAKLAGIDSLKKSFDIINGGSRYNEAAKKLVVKTIKSFLKIKARGQIA